MKTKVMKYETINLLHHEIHNNRPEGANYCCVITGGAPAAYVRFYRANRDGSVNFWTGYSWQSSDRKEIPTHWIHLPPETKTKVSTAMTDLKKNIEQQDPTLVTYVRVKYSYDWEWLALLVKGERLYCSDGETFYYFNNGKVYEDHKKFGLHEMTLTKIGPIPSLYRAKKVKVENLPCRTYAVWNPDQNGVEGDLTTYEDVCRLQELSGVSLSDVVTCPDIEEVVHLVLNVSDITLSYQELYQD